jgi:hypothetical protein
MDSLQFTPVAAAGWLMSITSHLCTKSELIIEYIFGLKSDLLEKLQTVHGTTL